MKCIVFVLAVSAILPAPAAAPSRCEQHNLATEQPGRVRNMAARWQQLQDSFIRNAGVAVPTTKKAQP